MLLYMKFYWSIYQKMLRSRHLIIIIGASKGFGKEVANAYAYYYPQDHIHYILTSRRINDIETTKDDILKIRSTQNNTNNDNDDNIETSFSLVHGDVSNINELQNFSNQLFDEKSLLPTSLSLNETSLSYYNSVIFVNNAGSLGWFFIFI